MPGGRTAYFGSIPDAVKYFSSLGFRFDANANVADVFLDILAGRGPNANPGVPTPKVSELVERWESSEFFKRAPSVSADASANKTISEIAKKRGATWLTQTWHCHNRGLLKQCRSLSTLRLEACAERV